MLKYWKQIPHIHGSSLLHTKHTYTNNHTSFQPFFSNFNRPHKNPSNNKNQEARNKQHKDKIKQLHIIKAVKCKRVKRVPAGHYPGSNPRGKTAVEHRRGDEKQLPMKFHQGLTSHCKMGLQEFAPRSHLSSRQVGC